MDPLIDLGPLDPADAEALHDALSVALREAAGTGTDDPSTERLRALRSLVSLRLAVNKRGASTAAQGLATRPAGSRRRP